MEGFPEEVPERRLNLDVSAILLAAHLEILTQVEEVFAPLRISSSLIPALAHMRNEVARHQQSRLATSRQIVDLADEGLLQRYEFGLPPDYENTQLVEECGEEWVALFEEVRASGGYLVGFLPVMRRDRSGPPAALPADADQYLVDCRGVAEALRGQGPLSSEEYRAVLEALGEEGRRGSKAIPRRGARLYCHANIPEVLATANVLLITCKRFQVYVEQKELDRARNELRDYEERLEVADWLASLIDQLRAGIDNGSYELIPAPPQRRTEPGKLSDRRPELDCLLDLFGFDAEDNDVIWVDDRFINSYIRRDTVPIIGINEVLKALVSAGVLDVHDYYAGVSRLRAANVRFIPLEKDEILYHLGQARVNSGAVVETRELEILRRYVAACLLQADILQRPSEDEGAPNRQGETAFVLGLGRAVHDTIFALWTTEADNEIECRARGEWLLSNVYIDYLALRNLTLLSEPEYDNLYPVAVSLVMLFSEAFVPEPIKVDDETSVRRKYFGWLFNRVLRRRFDADPQLVAATANILKSVLNAQKEAVKDAPEDQVIWLLQAFYEDLPEPIRDELGHDAEFLASIGITSTLAISIDGFHFDPGDFFRAATEAINNREATIAPVDSDEEIVFRPLDDSRNRVAFLLECPTSGFRRSVVTDDLGLLLDSPREREAVLRRNRHWFDCSESEFARAVADIVSTRDPRRRMEQAASWRQSSAAVYYESLYDQLSNREPFLATDLLPPRLAGLTRHLRLAPQAEPGESFQSMLATATQQLVHEEGLSATIGRFLGLPVPLPSMLVEAVIELPLEDRRILVKRLLRTGGSPVCKIHLVHLLSHLNDEPPVFQRLARWVIRDLLSAEGKREFDAFLAVLKWTSDEFNHWRETQVWSSQVRLAMVWAHAHRLFAILTSLSAPVSSIYTWFDQPGPRMPSEILKRDNDYWFDVAHPRQVTREAFLLGGISHGLSKETADLLDENLYGLLVAEVFPEIDGKRWPNLGLLRDPTLARNSLGSFLGGDRLERLLPLLGGEDASMLTSSSLRALVEQALDKLAESSSHVVAWMQLFAVLGDLPPYEGLADRLRAVISGTDFASLFRLDVETAAFALQVASLQVSNLDDENLRHYLREQLVKTAQALAERDSGDVLKVRPLLVECALRVSLPAQSSQVVVGEFVDLLTQLVIAWNAMIPKVKPVVQVLYDELPISQAQQFCPLLVRLRAY